MPFPNMVHPQQSIRVLQELSPADVLLSKLIHIACPAVSPLTFAAMPNVKEIHEDIQVQLARRHADLENTMCHVIQPYEQNHPLLT